MSRFSITLSSPNRRVDWNVRAMPAFATACGGRPLISRPAKAMRPAVGRSCPAMRLKIVVLPAPLGPMMLRISPSLRTRSSPLTASKPPNCRVSPCISSMGRRSLRRPSREPPESLHAPYDALWKKYRHRDQQETEEQQPELLEEPEHLRHDRHDECAHDRARNRPGSADHDEENPVQRDPEARVGGVEVGDIHSVQASGDPGDHPAEDER